MSRFSCVARWLRRGGIAAWVIGLALLGWALASNLTTKIYQARQERALLLTDTKETPVARLDRDPLVLGRIEIPRLGVTAIVREGDDAPSLAIAVGHIPDTARPGEGGNMVLAGHRDSFFRPLQDIRRQDRIRIVTPERAYDYLVDSTEVVDPEDTRVLDPTSDTVLSLVTCYPFHYVGHAPKRFIVRASLVAPLPVAVAGEQVLQASQDDGQSRRARR